MSSSVLRRLNDPRHPPVSLQAWLIEKSAPCLPTSTCKIPVEIIKLQFPAMVVFELFRNRYRRGRRYRAKMCQVQFPSSSRHTCGATSVLTRKGREFIMHSHASHISVDTHSRHVVYSSCLLLAKTANDATIWENRNGIFSSSSLCLSTLPSAWSFTWLRYIWVTEPEPFASQRSVINPSQFALVYRYPEATL